MKSTFIIFLAMLLIVPVIVSGSSLTITNDEIDDLVYQFDYSPENATSYRWSFGDGATSTEISPVHEYSSHQSYKVVCDVEIGGVIQSKQITLDATMPLVDGETGNVNVGDVSIAGGFIFIASLFMLALVKTNNHIGSDILGKGGKDIMTFFYSLGIVVGMYLIFTSLNLIGGV